MTYPILQSLAYLQIQSNADRNTIFLDNFIPFIVVALKDHTDKKINLSTLQELLKAQFGLTMPQNVIKAILHRARKSGYVTFDKAEYYKDESKIRNFSFSVMQEKVERIYYSELIASLVGFSQEKYKVSISDTEAESLLLSFINYYQISFYEGTKLDGELIKNSERATQKNKKYIVASFILNAKKQNPQIFGYLDVVVKGFMLSQVLYLPDAHETQKRFSKTKVFLDTSFIIYALGYSGPEFQNPAFELLQLLYKNNASLCCFQHTVEEIEGILAACSRNVGKDGYSDSPFGRTISYFQSTGETTFSIRLKISHLKTNIEKKLNIAVVPTPDYSEEKHVEGEVELFNLLKARMPHQRLEDPIRRDVASISAIYRLRRGSYSAYIENSRALFVTTSQTLAFASNDYFYKYNDKNLAPPCVTDYFLTNILWLKSPNQAPDLPMKRVIADAFAAVQPSDALMEKWLKEVENLRRGETTTEEDYYFMRSSDEVYAALMENTIGDVRAVTTEKVKAIVEAARNNIRKEAEEKLMPRLIESQNSITEYQSLLANDRREKAQVDERRRATAHNVSKLVSASCAVFLVMALVYVVLITVSFGLGDTNNPLKPFVPILPAPLILVAIVLFVGLTILTNYFGYPVPRLLRSLEINTEEIIYNLLQFVAKKI